MFKHLSLLLLLLSPLLLISQNIDSLIINKAQYYQSKYKVNCVEEKITDNRGDGFESLYGTRNFRPILHGIAYRGGGNNYYHKTNKRGNKNPLPMDGLNNLLDHGFSTSVYLYTENFEIAPPFITNQNKDTLHYFQLGGNTISSRDSILMLTYRSITNAEVGPVYLHCWNGWHQSGYVSAILLKQFCGFSTEKSLHYWEDCADNWTRGYDRIRNAIRDFEPLDEYKISDEISNAICPCYEDERADDIVVNNNDELKSLKLTILFPSNVSDLPPSVSTFLDEYANMLKSSSYLNVEIGGHTDSKGKKEYNLELSEQRAKNVMDYLILQGVDNSQLSYKGYGERILTNDCSDGVFCNDVKHAQNRRIEFRITNISHQVSFANNSASISKEDKQILNEILLILSSSKNMKVEIAGHADSETGTDFVNQNLSELRAERVYNYLKENGLNMDNISYKGYGSKQQRYGDDRDRRIEFKIIENNREKIYIVKKGDYLSKISKQFGVTVSNIKLWNDLNSDHLSIGQKLMIYLKNE